MSKHTQEEEAPEAGRPIVVLDGIYRGRVGHVVATGGGIAWVKIAGVEELQGLPAASVEAVGRRPVSPKNDGPGI